LQFSEIDGSRRGLGAWLHGELRPPKGGFDLEAEKLIAKAKLFDEEKFRILFSIS
jgi:hypothetical protein